LTLRLNVRCHADAMGRAPGPLSPPTITHSEVVYALEGARIQQRFNRKEMNNSWHRDAVGIRLSA